MHIDSKKDFYAGLVLLVVVAIFIQETGKVEYVQHGDLGPRFFPYLMSGFIGLLSLVLVWNSLSFGGQHERATQKPLRVTKEQLVFIGLFFVYVLAMPLLGYVPSTLLYLASSMIYLGKKSPRRYALYTLIAVAVTAAVYFIFVHLMMLFLP